MASLTHEITSKGFAKLLYEGLRLICRGTPEKEQFRLKIESRGSSNVYGEYSSDVHRLEDYFCCDDDFFYGLALEVAYS